MPQPNLNKLMKQVQEMQAEMMKAQDQLKDEIVEASAGGGMVTVKLSGDLELKEVKIKPDALGGEGEGLEAEDVEMLQDMVLAAVNEAIRSAQELANRKLGSLTGGLGGGPGGLGLPGL
jgi:nucleoid-associated protein EbfC